MSVATLNPRETAYIAQKIYDIRSANDVSRIFLEGSDLKFSINNESKFDGLSGGVFLTAKTGFGIAARGKGEFEGDALIAIRGTDTLFDGITDAYVGNLYPSTTGKMVHSGFNKVFLSFKQELETFFSQFSPRRVHCVGHSLGGAVATLVAEWVDVHGMGEPVLYTFGSPRVGVASFAGYLTGRLNDNNIYRVYHKTDPVSMVPIWPFTHVPLPGTECYIEKPGVFAPSMHKMSKYIASVSNKETWDGMKRNRPVENSDKVIEAWLNARGPAPMTHFNMILLQQALSYVLKKVLYLTGVSLQALLGGAANFLDILAMAFEKAAKISSEVADHIKNLMRRILSMLGMVVDNVKDITASFIRWALFKFAQAVYQLARTAIHLANS